MINGIRTRFCQRAHEEIGLEMLEGFEQSDSAIKKEVVRLNRCQLWQECYIAPARLRAQTRRQVLCLQ